MRRTVPAGLESWLGLNFRPSRVGVCLYEVLLQEMALINLQSWMNEQMPRSIPLAEKHFVF